MIEVVIGDVHARAGALRAVLEGVGALDSRGRRQAGFWVVQVGDLLDRRASPEANLRTARLAADALDIVLVGNHELRMLACGDRRHGAALATLTARGWPLAAAALGDWLVSHAGVHPDFACLLPPDAGECAAEINDRWHRRPPVGPGDPLFDWVGPGRRGCAPHGGIVWLAAKEWPRGGHAPWGQISGHAPQRAPRLLEGRRWAIDVGASGDRLAALVRRSGRGRWRPVVISGESRKRAAAIAA